MRTGVANVYVLIHNRRAFTDIVLTHLVAYTRFLPINRLVLVDDGSTDGAEDVARRWVAAIGSKAEYRRVDGGSVSNALWAGSAHTTDDDVDFAVKLDNDMILFPNWLAVMLAFAQHNPDFDVYGMVCAGEFFETAPEELWKLHDYRAHETDYTGGNFLMRWGKFLETRGMGYDPHPAHYLVGSIDGLHRELSARGELRCCVPHPHLPVFKLDKCLADKYKPYKFYEARGIDHAEIARLTNEYNDAGHCRKRYVNGRVINNMPARAAA